MKICNLCNEFFVNNILYFDHLFLNHDPQKKKLYSFFNKKFECKICKFKVISKEEYLNHLKENHIDECIKNFSNIDLNKNKEKKNIKKPNSKFDVYIPNKNKENKNEEKKLNPIKEKINPILLDFEPIKPISDLYQDNSDDEINYALFVASTMNKKGIEIYPIEINEINPIENKIEISNNNFNEINKEFWNDLEKLFYGLSDEKKIIYENKNEKYICKICNKEFFTFTKTLQHCWENHNNIKKN